MLDWLTKKYGRAKDTAIVKQLVSWRTGVPHKTSHGDIRHLARWFQSWAYICIDRNATCVAQHPPQLFRRSDTTTRPTRGIHKDQKAFLKVNYPTQFSEDAVIVEDHPFLDLMANPNPILDGNGLLWLTTAALQAMGEAFWHISFDGDGMPNEIWPLPSQLVFPILGENRVYDQYEFRVGGFIQRFSADEIIHFRKPSLIDTISAMGNMRGVIEAVETNTKLQEYERAIFENMAVPDILLVPKGQTSAAQLEGLIGTWKEKFRTWLKAGSVGAAPVEMDVKRLGLTMRELQHKDTKIGVIEEIAAGHGVPMPILRVEGTTFNNLHNGMFLWGKFTITPLQGKIADTINCRMMPYYVPRSEFESADEVIPARPQYWIAFPNPVPEDEDAAEARSTQRLASSKATINEERAVDGQEPVPWGDEPWMPAGLLQPSQASAQLEFDRTLAEGEAARQVTADQATLEAGAEAPEIEPPSFGELVQSLTLFKDGADVDAYNMVRDALATRFGVPLTAINEIAPASTGVVNPADAADPPAGSQANEGSTEGNGEGEEGSPPKKPKGKKRDDGDDGESGKGAARGNAGDATREQNSRLELGRQRAAKWYGPLNDSENKYAFEPGVAEEAADSLAKTLARVYHDFVEEIIQSLGASLGELGDDLSAVRMFGDTPETREAVQKDLATSMVRAAIKKDKWVTEFGEVSVPFLEIAFKRGTALGELDLRGRIDIIKPVGADVIKRNSRAIADQFASSTVETTGDEVLAIINEALAEGLGGREVTAKIGLMFDAKKDVAEMIARTEINNVMNFAASETWRTNGVTKHEWFAAPDACEFCDALDGREVKIGTPFVKMGGSLQGTDGGTFKAKFKTIKHPTLHPRCRCTLLPVV